MKLRAGHDLADYPSRERERGTQLNGDIDFPGKWNNKDTSQSAHLLSSIDQEDEGGLQRQRFIDGHYWEIYGSRDTRHKTQRLSVLIKRKKSQIGKHLGRKVNEETLPH